MKQPTDKALKQQPFEDKPMNPNLSKKTTAELDQQLHVLSTISRIEPSSVFTSRVIDKVYGQNLKQSGWLETPLRVAAAVLFLVTLTGMNLYSVRTISASSDNAQQMNTQVDMDDEDVLAEWVWITADYPQLLTE